MPLQLYHRNFITDNHLEFVNYSSSYALASANNSINAFLIASVTLFQFAGEGQVEKKITRHKFGLKLSGQLPPDECNNYIIQSIKFNSKISMYLYKLAY